MIGDDLHLMPSSEAPDSITRINDHLVHSESMFGGFPAGHKRRELMCQVWDEGSTCAISFTIMSTYVVGIIPILRMRKLKSR